MSVQILDEYKNRTEYRLLSDFYSCQKVKIEALQQGILVLPGIVIKKMPEQQVDLLNHWIDDASNQIIITPAWNEMNLKQVFNTSIDIEIYNSKGEYNGIAVDYEIRTLAKDIVFQQDMKNYAIHFRKNTGTGLITVVTLPLLDYRLIQFQDRLKVMFDSLINVNKNPLATEMKDMVFEVNDVHVSLIILAGAQEDLSEQISGKFRLYFGSMISESTLRQKYDELITHGYIQNNALADKGKTVVQEKRLKAFIDTVRQRREKDDGWN